MDPNRRAHQRQIMQPMYTTVTAHRITAAGTLPLCGHIYDISEGGVRIELDEALELGEHVNVNIDLPGAPGQVTALGSVVWVNSGEDDPGPRRMALRFEQFHRVADRDRLVSYLAGGPGRVAA